MRKRLFKFFFFIFGFRIKAVTGNNKGTIIILIDGLSYDALLIALKKRLCPSLAKLQKKYSFHISPYYCGLPAATTATEAQLFYGNHNNIPSFTWFDRKLGTFVRGNRSLELAQFEDTYEKKRHLFHEGSVIMSVYTGGATELNVSGGNLTLSRSQSLLNTAHYLLMAFLYPIQLMRTGWLSLKTIFLYHWSRRQSTEEAFARIIFGQFSCFLTEIEIMRNTKKIFVDFLLYDEYAHEYGPTHKTSLSTLRLIDHYIKRILRTAKGSERQYEYIILSDHGQTESIPYDKIQEQSAMDIQAALADSSYTIKKTFGGFIPNAEKKELSIVPAGSTLQLYFSPYLKTGVTEKNLTEVFPGFIKRLLMCEAFGWILVRQTVTSAVLYGKNGLVIFTQGLPSIIHGDPFPLMDKDEVKLTIKSFEYYSTFPNNGDLVIFGDVPEKGRVYAFEKNHGNHGGFYGPMVKPFIMTDREDLTGKSMDDIFDTIALTI